MVDVVQVAQSSVGVDNDLVRNKSNKCISVAKDVSKATSNMHTCVMHGVQTCVANAAQDNARNAPN